MRSPIGALRNLRPPKTLQPDMPVRYASRAASRFAYAQRTGAEAQLRTMETVGTVHAIVSRSAKAVAAVEWHLYRKAPSGKKEDRVEVTSHAALDLLNKPNRFFRTRDVFMEAGAQHKGLTGETWWVIARSPLSSLPLELWPVSPARMTPVPDPDTFIAGYMYSSPDGEQIALRLEDVIFIRTPHPSNPYRGISPIQPLMTDIDTSRYSAEWIRNYFVNGAEPGGIIEVPNALSDPEFDQLRDRWNESHKGVANAHRVAILEHGQWKDRRVTQRDMQFVELRDGERELIREGFGFPKPMLGTVDDTNRANMEAADTMFARWLVLPDVRAIRGALNSELLPLYGRDGEGLEFDFDSPVPDDVESETKQLTARSNAAAALVLAGFEPKGTLSAVGLPEIPFSGAPALPPAKSPAAPARPVARLALPAVPPPRSAWDAATAGLFTAQQDDSALEQVRTDQEHALTRLLGEWDGVESAWVDALTDQIEAAVDDGDPAALAALAVDSDQAADVLRGELGAMARLAAERMVQEAAAQGVTVAAPDVDEALTNRARIPAVWAAFGGELADIAVAAAALLGSGLAAAAGREALRLFTPGADGAGVAGQVKGFMRGLSNRLKLDQLGGALHRATNLGRLATLEAAPVATYWASERMDTSTCPPCREIDGTEFADLPAARAAYGAGPYHACEGGIRCRGTVTATWE